MKNEVNNFSERLRITLFVGSTGQIFDCIYIEFSVFIFFFFLTLIFSFN